MKTKILNLRIDPDLKKKAKKIAEEDGRTLSNWVTRLIEREVAKARKGGK
jgi:antitoxin component of RelBE/YafQ-DinJ toxin-antitoxin module